MIIVQQSPFDFDGFIASYPSSSVERDILAIMNSSNTKITYRTTEELAFELKLRKAIIDASKALNRSRMGFAVFRKTRCNEEYWIRTDIGGFLLKRDVKPSAAILDIYTNGEKYATECATAMVIVYYKALLEAMGEEIFDKLFTRIELMNWHNIDSRLSEIGYTVKVDYFLPGDRRYFKNPDVDPKTPQWQGENVIDLSKGLYYGHGVGINNGDYIIKALNQSRKEDATQSAFLMDSVGRPNFKSLYKLMNQ